MLSGRTSLWRMSCAWSFASAAVVATAIRRKRPTLMAAPRRRLSDTPGQSSSTRNTRSERRSSASGRSTRPGSRALVMSRSCSSCRMVSGEQCFEEGLFRRTGRPSQLRTARWSTNLSFFRIVSVMVYPSFSSIGALIFPSGEGLRPGPLGGSSAPVVDDVEERAQVDRLLDDASNGQPVRLLLESRDDNDRDGLVSLAPGDGNGELPAVHAGHHQVEQDQARFPDPVQHFEALLAVGGGVDLVALELQRQLESLPDPILILDDEHAFGLHGCLPR